MYRGVFLHGMRVRRGCWRTRMWRRVDITSCRVCDRVQSSARARAFHMRWAGPRREVGGLGGLSRPDRDGSSIGVAFLSEPTSMCGGRLSVLPWAVKPTEQRATVRESTPIHHPILGEARPCLTYIHSPPSPSPIIYLTRPAEALRSGA